MKSPLFFYAHTEHGKGGTDFPNHVSIVLSDPPRLDSRRRLPTTVWPESNWMTGKHGKTIQLFFLNNFQFGT